MQTIYYNGTIITMDEKEPQAEAVCINDGTIVKVGKQKDILGMQDAHATLVDLEGKTMFPGFIDPHSHFVGVANSLSQCDLSGAACFDEIAEKIKQFITDNAIKEGEWVFGSNYDHNFLTEKKHPDKFLLDKISTVNPIVLIHASSHMGVANSAALSAQNITAETPDPEGGKFAHVQGTNEPTGFMEENAFINFQNHVPMLGVERLMQLIVKAQEIYASYGITTIQDGMVAKPLFQLIQYAVSQKLLYIDVIGFIDILNCRDLVKEHKEFVGHYVNHFKIGGYKVFLDGSPQGRTAWMETPYKDSEDGYCGYPILKDEHLHDIVHMALEDKQQLLAHCNGDAAAQQYISQFEKVHREYPELDTKRPVMIHAQLVRRDQLKRMPEIGMMPSFFIAHTYFWGDIHIENFGKERADSISPAKSAVDIGIPYTFHQDSPVLMPDMMRTIWCAVNRITKKGVRIGEEERVSVYDALKAITVNAAYQYFEEDKKGSITEGKQADLVILDCNPLEIDEMKLADVKVLETIKAGKSIYKAK